jgi:hypothetical protein
MHKHPATAVAGKRSGMKYLYVIACCLLVAAIVADGWGKRYYSKATLIMAKSQSHHSNRDVASANADAAISTGKIFTNGGFALAVLGVVLWAASMAEDKRFTPVPMALLALYIGLFLIMV